MKNVCHNFPKPKLGFSIQEDLSNETYQMEEVHLVNWKVVKRRSGKHRDSLTAEKNAGCRKGGVPKNKLLYYNMQLAY